MALKESEYCFGCSTSNPCGLHLTFTSKETEVSTCWTPPREYEGFPGILHGGITASILDEVMAQVVRKLHITAVTVEMNVKFHKKTVIGKPIIAKARFNDRIDKVVSIIGTIQDEEGNVLSEGVGKFYMIEKK